MGKEKLALDIKLISRETIKPASPTPSHLQTRKLSLIDQIFPAFHIPILLFYPSKPPNTPPLEITSLTTSLSHTLSKFYPLAGRCIDDSTLLCSDEGIPFIHTKANCNLDFILSSPYKLDVLTEFLPPRDLLALGPRLISELVPLAFQINVFSCGGVVIGCYMLHKLLDAASLGTFFRYWSALASKRYEDIIDPDFDVIAKVFPPSPQIEQVLVPDLCKEEPPPDSLSPSPSVVVLVKSFVIKKDDIRKVKNRAVCENVPNPTSFETVAGFIWSSIVAATAEEVSQTTVLSISVNMRSRTNTQLPSESMGNFITDMHAVMSTKMGKFQFPEVVSEIHEAISKAKAKVERYQGENGVEEICADRKAASQFVMEHSSSSSSSSSSSCVYQLSSWCRLGLNEADFGFGKPNWIIPTDGIIPVSLRNFIFFTDYNDDLTGDGIEVWLFLEEKEMQLLESNSEFLEFASPK